MDVYFWAEWIGYAFSFLFSQTRAIMRAEFTTYGCIIDNALQRILRSYGRNHRGRKVKPAFMSKWGRKGVTWWCYRYLPANLILCVTYVAMRHPAAWLS